MDSRERSTSTWSPRFRCCPRRLRERVRSLSTNEAAETQKHRGGQTYGSRRTYGDAMLDRTIIECAIDEMTWAWLARKHRIDERYVHRD